MAYQYALWAYARADVNQADKHGVSPLYIAAEMGHVGMAMLLLSHQGNPQKKMNNGNTPLSQTESNGYREVVGLLKGLKR